MSHPITAAGAGCLSPLLCDREHNTDISAVHTTRVHYFAIGDACSTCLAWKSHLHLRENTLCLPEYSDKARIGAGSIQSPVQSIWGNPDKDCSLLDEAVETFAHILLFPLALFLRFFGSGFRLPPAQHLRGP